MFNFELLFLFCGLALVLVIAIPIGVLILTWRDFKRARCRFQFSILELLAVPLAMGYFVLLLSVLDALKPTASNGEKYARVITLASHFTIGGFCGWLYSGMPRFAAARNPYMRIAAAFIGAHAMPIASLGVFFAIWLIIIKVTGLK